MTAAEKAQRLLSTGCVQIVSATDTLILARVRGDSSLYDVRWHRDTGWSCSCECYGPRCSHIEAVRMVTMRPPKALVS